MTTENHNDDVKALLSMKSSTAEIPPLLGTSMGGGFYAGRIRIESQVFALIVAPRALGEVSDKKWITRDKDVPSAASYFDGLANTKAMADAGSKSAKWAQDLRIGDADDWYLPAQDELEIMYRNLKPGTCENYCWMRSGINLSAVESGRPYAPDIPTQTLAEAFQTGGDEAFAEEWYWSSTQHASNSASAWSQNFYDGSQLNYGKSSELRARAVRRLAI